MVQQAEHHEGCSWGASTWLDPCYKMYSHVPGVGLQVTHHRKPGSIAPGLAEQLVIEFTGQQLRYHYDCIRVQTEVSQCS
jgi:hypothetical protein